MGWWFIDLDCDGSAGAYAGERVRCAILEHVSSSSKLDQCLAQRGSANLQATRKASKDRGVAAARRASVMRSSTPGGGSAVGAPRYPPAANAMAVAVTVKGQRPAGWGGSGAMFAVRSGGLWRRSTGCCRPKRGTLRNAQRLPARTLRRLARWCTTTTATAWVRCNWRR